VGVRLTQADLERAFGFTPGDLEANRAGRLSEAQASVLRAEVPGNRRAAIQYGAATLALTGAAAATYVFSSGGWWIVPAMFAFVGAIVSAVSSLGASERRHLGGAVRHHSGELDVGSVTQASGESVRLVIGDDYYGITPAQHEALRAAVTRAAGVHDAPTRSSRAGFAALALDGRYRIYFLVIDDGAESRVLSAEPRD
jgi:hypothetical protein